jgi:putative inorganic carbon (HCO3(-)) transporter
MNNKNNPAPMGLTFKIVLALVFLRPFISGRSLPALEFLYDFAVLVTFLFYLAFGLKRTVSAPGISLPLFTFLAAVSISSLSSLNPYASQCEIVKLVIYLAIFFLTIQMNRAQLQDLFLVVVFTSVIIAAYSIYQYLFSFPQTLDHLGAQGRKALSRYARIILVEKRVLGTFFSPNLLAGYLVLCISFSGGLLLNRNSRKTVRTFAGLSIIVATASIALTKSLGGVSSLLAAILVFAIITLLSSAKLGRINIIFIILTIVTLGLLLILIFNQRWGSFFDFQNPHNSIVQRLMFWQAAIRILKDFPVLGVGPGNFSAVYAKYKLPLAWETNFTHNSYLQIGAETGIVGILSFLYMVSAFFKKMFICLKERGPSQGLALGATAATLTFLVHNFVDYTLFIPEVSLFWWIGLGAIVVISKTASSLNNGRDKLRGLLLRIILIAFTFWAIQFTIRGYLADLYFGRGISQTVEGQSEAILNFEKAIKIQPNYDLYHLILAEAYAELASDAQSPFAELALREYRRAISLNPFWPFHYRELGLFYIKIEKPKLAKQAFREALSFYPHNEDFRRYIKAAEKNSSD